MFLFLIDILKYILKCKGILKGILKCNAWIDIYFEVRQIGDFFVRGAHLLWSKECVFYKPGVFLSVANGACFNVLFI